ncbi:MAG: FAD-dependent oxidoreductase, partial [Cellulomonadaceae bacterium]|nr:FAD-dependent oxidoreductase [Cellulomonadaceae bacterium]
MTGDATTGVVVVGAGVAGLVVARELAVAGVEVTVLEASGRTGGCVASQEVAGLVLDAGAESFATRTTAVSALLADLGLGDDVVAPAPLGSWAQLADGAVPLPRTGLLGVPVTPWSADVRRAVGVLGALRACLDRVLPARVGVPDGPVSLASVVRASKGRRVLERLEAPVVTVVHATDPSVLDLDAAMPGVRAALRTTGSLGAAVGLLRASAPPGAAAAGLRGGMHRLPQALSSQVTASGGVVRTGVRVSGIERSDQGWTITTDAGPVTARHVVLAVPGPVAAALLQPVAGAAAAL